MGKVPAARVSVYADIKGGYHETKKKALDSSKSIMRGEAMARFSAHLKEVCKPNGYSWTDHRRSAHDYDRNTGYLMGFEALISYMGANPRDVMALLEAYIKDIEAIQAET